MKDRHMKKVQRISDRTVKIQQKIDELENQPNRLGLFFISFIFSYAVFLVVYYIWIRDIPLEPFNESGYLKLIYITALQLGTIWLTNLFQLFFKRFKLAYTKMNFLLYFLRSTLKDIILSCLIFLSAWTFLIDQYSFWITCLVYFALSICLDLLVVIPLGGRNKP